jgi:membrane protease YdiL (CAAX protease family)
MNSIASAFAKPFRLIGNGSFPRRVAGGVSQPPWSWRAGALAVLVSFVGYWGLQELLDPVWKLRQSGPLFPALVCSIPMLCCLRYLARRAGTTVEKVFGLRGARLGRVLVSGMFLFVLEALLMGATWAVVSRLGFEAKPETARDSSVFLILDMTVWAPLCEELSFRGLLYTSLRTRLGVASSVVITAGAFALAHTPISFHKVGVLFADALLSSLWYERTRSLWPNIISHSLNNLL